MNLSYMTIQSFAIEMQMSVDHVIQHFLNIGITKTKFDFVTKKEKEIFFNHMNQNKTAIFNKLFLKRKTYSTLNISNVNGKNKQIEIEVRKKRVYMVKQCLSKEFTSAVSDELLKDNQKINRFDNNQSELPNLDENMKFDIKQKDSVKIDGSIFTVDNVRMDKIDNKHRLEDKIYNTNDKKVQKNYDKNYNKKKSKKIDTAVTHHKDHELSKIYVKKGYISDKINELDNFCVSQNSNNNDYESEDKKRHSNIHIKHKNSGKIFKSKKHGNYTYSNLTNNLDEENNLYVFSDRSKKSKYKKSILIQSFNKPVHACIRDIIVDKTISVSELSKRMSVKSSHMIKVMMNLGLMVTVNQILDQETAQLVIEEMGHNPVLRRENELEELIMGQGKYDKNNHVSNDMNIGGKQNCVISTNRAPVVTIMGHVDHGKTSLLDYIRSSKVALSETGGITQSIGVYRVKTKNGIITFLDTPGHEAFINMRVRGIELTDIVVLVISADDGVMPQTVESIHHICNAKIPVIVAINKVDKSTMYVERIKHELSNYGLSPEEWGGDTQFINVSALSGEGVDNLLDSILLQAEVLELQSIYSGITKSIVIESYLDRGRGPVVTVLVREGELKCGDVILCGTQYGRIRAMKDVFGCSIELAGPSTPVELLGLSGIPNSGDVMVVVNSEKKAREVASYRQEKNREIKLSKKKGKVVKENIFNDVSHVIKVIELNFIIKSDTQGSIEAICSTLKKLSTNKIMIKILLASIGNITETDSVLALTSNSIILGFNIKPDTSARHIIESNNLDVRYYCVIYDLVDDIKKIIHELLIPKCEYEVIGIAEVCNIFRSLKYGSIAGCLVKKGIVKIHKKMKVIRNHIVIYEGEIESLHHFKNNVHEVKSGMECGVIIKNYKDIHLKDIIEVLDVRTNS